MDSSAIGASETTPSIIVSWGGRQTSLLPLQSLCEYERVDLSKSGLSKKDPCHVMSCKDRIMCTFIVFF